MIIGIFSPFDKFKIGSFELHVCENKILFYTKVYFAPIFRLFKVKLIESFTRKKQLTNS